EVPPTGSRALEPDTRRLARAVAAVEATSLAAGAARRPGGRDGGRCVGGAPGRVCLPRMAAPWRWATRYTEDSPMPNVRAISDTGIVVPAYRRVTSPSCSSLSLRRVGLTRCASFASSRLTAVEAAGGPGVGAFAPSHEANSDLSDC